MAINLEIDENLIKEALERVSLFRHTYLMPEISGFEFCRQLKKIQRLKKYQLLFVVLKISKSNTSGLVTD